LLAALEARVRFGGVVEWKNFVNHGMKDFARDEIEHGKEFRFSAHVGAKHGEMSAEKETEIDLRVVAGGRAAGDETSVDTERRETF